MLEHSRFVPLIHVSKVLATFCVGQDHLPRSYHKFLVQTLFSNSDEGATHIFNHLDKLVREAKDLGPKVFHPSNDTTNQLNHSCVGQKLRGPELSSAYNLVNQWPTIFEIQLFGVQRNPQVPERKITLLHVQKGQNIVFECISIPLWQKLLLLQLASSLEALVNRS